MGFVGKMTWGRGVVGFDGKDQRKIDGAELADV